MKMLEDNLKNLIGHEPAKRLLMQSFDAGRCAVYLLAGPPHVGKGLLARMIAASLHGEHSVDKLHVDTLIFDDVVEAHSKGGEKNWKQAVDAVVHFVSLSPVSSKHKAVIIEDIDRLSSQAANALLKALEEPSPSTKFILTATNLDEVLATIRSRSQVIRLNRLPDEQIRKYVSKIAPDRVEEIVALADGAIGAANKLISDPDELGKEMGHLKNLINFLEGEIYQSLPLADIKDRSMGEAVLSTWINLLRRSMLSEIEGQPNQLLGPLCSHKADKLSRLLNDAEAALSALRLGANVRITFESLALSWGWGEVSGARL